MRAVSFSKPSKRFFFFAFVFLKGTYLELECTVMRTLCLVAGSFTVNLGAGLLKEGFCSLGGPLFSKGKKGSGSKIATGKK